MRPLLVIAGAFGGAATAAMGAAVGYGYMLGSVPRECPHCDEHKRLNAQQHLANAAKMNGTRSKIVPSTTVAVDEAHRRRAYDGLASSFDEELEWHELLTGIKLMRWWMMRQAKGDTLEVAAGTGRNFQYYPVGTRLTATDCSSAMVEVCRAKADNDYPAGDTSKNARGGGGDGGDAGVSRGGARFAKLEVRVDDAGKMRFKSGSFDTVVDTFGLCSYEDPVAVLREMQRVCRKGNNQNQNQNQKQNKASGGGGGGGVGDADTDDGGRLFLLEHGRSERHGWLSNILDKFAAPHAAKWGCYWNRDILQIVRDAGLEIVESRTFHFGTTYYIVAKPKDS